MSRPFTPRRGMWPAPMTTLSVLAAVALVIAAALSAAQPTLRDRAAPRILRRAQAAEDMMARAVSFIRDARRAEGIESEGGGGTAAGALIGAELTPITTTLGNLEAKRIATSPAWASALALRLHDAGLRPGDVVAAGLSGSFPGLNLALVSACQSLDLRLVAISSVTASSWGANQPGFTWPEMEARLVRGGIIRRASVAVTAGGAADRALDLDAEGRAQAVRIAQSSAASLGVPVLAAATFEEAVVLRLRIYSIASSGVTVRLYANVGGTEASLGRSPVVLRLRNGFLPGIPFDFSENRGVIARFAERGVPILTLLNVRDLAVRWGLL